MTAKFKFVGVLIVPPTNRKINLLRSFGRIDNSHAQIVEYILAHAKPTNEVNTMIIAGLQKMTLLDFPGKVACTVFLQGCNFRCPFCHNSGLLDTHGSDYIPQEELLAFLKKRVGLLEGVCITGGEPTLQKDLPQLLESIKALGFSVKLDTNGNRPAVLKDLVSRGLVDYVAMDIKNCPERYGETAGIPRMDLAGVEESMLFLMHGELPFEFRTTVVQELHRPEDLLSIGNWFQRLSPEKKVEKYFLQPYTDRDSVLSGGLHAPEKAVLQEFLRIISEFVHKAEIRGVE